MQLQDYKLLVTDNDQEAASRVLGTLSSRGMHVRKISRLPRIDNLSGEDDVVIVIITGGLHEKSTISFLESIKYAPASVGVICLAEPTEPKTLAWFDSLGVDEVFEKPVSGEDIAQATSRLLDRNRLVGSIGIIGRTPPMREVIERVAQYSQVNSMVLISGDSGTGKELVAQALHRLSARRHQQFIAVNCGAIAEGVLESELFGHEKGSFTGASSLRKGYFEIADGGTIFLDEVGEMPLGVQVKLLRVLEEKEFMRVGGSNRIRVNVRVLAATNKDLELEVERGAFRRDLYYRLKVLSVVIPPLRERREDIPLLFNSFIKQFSRENDKTFAGIDPEALEILKNYDWPGNVRELRNLAESMVVLSLGNRIRPHDIPEQIFRRGDPGRLLPIPYGLETEQRGGREAMELGLLYQAIIGMQKELRELKRIIAGDRENVSRPTYAAAGRPETPAAYDSGGGEDPHDISALGSVRFEEGEEQPAAAGARSMREVEKRAIARALEEVDGNRRKAAGLLGIGERTLYRKIGEYGLK
ncbi:MAG: sigma-54-dependent Fis family transcriptional regulator [Candidatus Glassbacteria bacterium]|nr:sigma-54-dependent Fis family transcriptional regulator [Candidatus Glassbacteria bacterium]